MKFTELKNDLSAGARGVYLIEGDDAYFRTKAEEQIKAAFLTMPELNFTCFDGAAYKGAALTEITAALLSFPFMAEKRVIKITDFYPSESDYDKYLKDAIENLPPTTILLIVNADAGKGANCVSFKRKKYVCFVDCNRTDEETVTKWAYLTLKRAGIAASADACRAIAEYCLCDMSRVSVEVEKFVLLKKDGAVTREDVDALVYKDADYRIYEMTNAVARKNYRLFCEIAYDLLSKGYDGNSLISSLLNYFKNLLAVHTSPLPDARLAETLKMKEYGVKKSREQASAIGKESLIYFVNRLYALSSDFKSGKISSEGALTSAFSAVFFGGK